MSSKFSDSFSFSLVVGPFWAWNGPWPPSVSSHWVGSSLWGKLLLKHWIFIFWVVLVHKSAKLITLAALAIWIPEIASSSLRYQGCGNFAIAFCQSKRDPLWKNGSFQPGTLCQHMKTIPMCGQKWRDHSFFPLVGGLEHFFISPFSWECHHPNWPTPSYFRGVGLNHQLVHHPSLNGIPSGSSSLSSGTESCPGKAGKRSEKSSNS